MQLRHVMEDATNGGVKQEPEGLKQDKEALTTGGLAICRL